MREPAFWWRAASWQSLLLAPVGAMYGWFSARRMRQSGVRASVPVICVGNYHVGGAGKTPTVIALIARLQQMGEKPFVLSRGYGGALSGPLRVDAQLHGASDVGDEPLLIASYAPVIVARDRVAGAHVAVSAGATVIVMDDGFQNPSLHKDMSIVVIDAHRGAGNGAVFPAGPLRAPLAVQLPRTDALLIIGEGHAADAVVAQLSDRPVFRGQIVPEPPAVSSLGHQRVLAFAGIGDPERFVRTLRAAGIDVASSRAFADHHPYTQADLDGLQAEARALGLTLVTTEKDKVRLQNLRGGASIATLPVTLGIDDSEALSALLTSVLAGRRAQAT